MKDLPDLALLATVGSLVRLRGHAILRSEYDARGNAVVMRAFDAGLRPTVDQAGNAIRRRVYDLQNRLREETTCDAGDAPLASALKYWKSINEDDSKGRNTRRDTATRAIDRS